MVIKNFKRVELKYRINSTEKERLILALSKYMKLDEFGKTTISSAYLDTDNWDIISRSIEKPMYKEKLRIRCYDYPNAQDPVFLELKKKYDGVVYKRRVTLSRAAAEMFVLGTSYEDAIKLAPLKDEQLQNNLYTPNNLQIANEIMAFMERHDHPKVKVITSCDRFSFKLKDEFINSSNFKEFEKNLRITVDSNLWYCDVDKSGIYFKDEDFSRLIPSSDSILEIKCIGGIPIWLNNILNAEKIYPTSFSKCGTAVEIIWRDKLKEKGVA